MSNRKVKDEPVSGDPLLMEPEVKVGLDQYRFR